MWAVWMLAVLISYIRGYVAVAAACEQHSVPSRSRAGRSNEAVPVSPLVPLVRGGAGGWLRPSFHLRHRASQLYMLVLLLQRLLLQWLLL